MENKNFYSKVLLFGEYGIISNSNALSIPFKEFFGSLKKCTKLNQDQKKSNDKLIELYRFISDNNIINDVIDIQGLKNDLELGLHFDSNIPVASGLGSSGALVASIFHKYLRTDINNLQIEDIKNLLSIIESKFHGKSSGLDPLVSFYNKSILLSNQKIKLLDDIDYGDCMIYLVDSKINASTKDMIEIFNKKMNNNDFSNFLNNVFINKTNVCIDNLLNNSSSFQDSIKELSEITFKNFQEMIPNQIKEKWEYGLKTNSYFMKLCGSGGGGFFTVFDFESQVSSDSTNFKSLQI